MEAIRKHLLMLVIVSVTGITASLAQQGPQYTQFMFNNLAINPAYAGADEHLSLTVLARNQWTSIDNAPSTQSLAAHTLFGKRVGVGISFVHDRIGVHKNTNAVASYAYHLRAGRRSFLSFGLQAGFKMFRSDYPSLAGSSNDPLLARYVKETKLSLGTGLYYRSPKLDVGISFPGLLSRKLNLNDTSIVKFRNADVLGYVRYRIPVSSSFVVQPSALIKLFPGVPASFDVNLMVIYKEVLSTGISYRNHESIDLVIKLQLTERLEAGYSYDFPVSNGSLLNTGSHEVMLHYVFRKDTKNIASPR